MVRRRNRRQQLHIAAVRHDALPPALSPSPPFSIPGSLHFSAFLTYILPPFSIPGKFRFVSFLAYISPPFSSPRSFCFTALFGIISPPFSSPGRPLSRSSWLLLCLLILALCRSLSRSVSVKCWLENAISTPLSFVDITIEMSFLFLNGKLLFSGIIVSLKNPLFQNAWCDFHAVSRQTNAGCPKAQYHVSRTRDFPPRKDGILELSRSG